jgi:hypothetical protein
MSHYFEVERTHLAELTTAVDRWHLNRARAQPPRKRSVHNSRHTSSASAPTCTPTCTPTSTRALTSSSSDVGGAGSAMVVKCTTPPTVESATRAAPAAAHQEQPEDRGEARRERVSRELDRLSSSFVEAARQRVRAAVLCAHAHSFLSALQAARGRALVRSNLTGALERIPAPPTAAQETHRSTAPELLYEVRVANARLKDELLPPLWQWEAAQLVERPVLSGEFAAKLHRQQSVVDFQSLVCCIRPFFFACLSTFVFDCFFFWLRFVFCVLCFVFAFLSSAVFSISASLCLCVRRIYIYMCVRVGGWFVS